MSNTKTKIKTRTTTTMTMTTITTPTTILCAICNDELTLQNVVNTNCGHQQCKNCFWKWCETSNSCPFCRADMIKRDREKELEMKNMLERRLEILNELNSLYNEQNQINQRLKNKQKKIISLKKKNGELNVRIQLYIKILDRICEWEENPGLAMNRWQQENDKYKKAKKKLENILENNAIRMKMSSCLKEMSEKNPDLIRGTSLLHGQRPILNINTNPVPRPWLETRHTINEMGRSSVQSPFPTPAPRPQAPLHYNVIHCLDDLNYNVNMTSSVSGFSYTTQISDNNEDDVNIWRMSYPHRGQIPVLDFNNLS